MQEDQMWAMQDYIQQYQQLVCQFRSENASLRRQLNEERGGTAVERESQPTPRMPVSPPAPSNGKKPAPSPNNDMPDVPPLGQETSNDLRRSSQSLAKSDNSLSASNGYAQVASYEAPADNTTVQTTDEPPALNSLRQASASDSAIRDRATLNASSDILLSGEVVANNGAGGPRLVIDIESFDQSGRVVGFDGNVSLALLTSEGGVQRRLARWDFGPDEVCAAVDNTANEPTMHFRVELPAGTKVEGPAELWAKLAPTNGARLFSHAKLNLTKPGVFSSRNDKIWACEESVVAASYVESSTQPAESATTINESEWSTARPGKPAILPPESDETTGGWKAASGPVPAVVENAKPPATMRNDRPTPIGPAPIKVAPVEVAKKPSWAPERPGTPPHAARQTWSATR